MFINRVDFVWLFLLVCLFSTYVPRDSKNKTIDVFVGSYAYDVIVIYRCYCLTVIMLDNQNYCIENQSFVISCYDKRERCGTRVVSVCVLQYVWGRLS